MSAVALSDQEAPKRSAGRPRKIIDQQVVDCFGTMKDQDVANRFGRSLKWVRKNRQRLGIAPYTGDQLILQREQNPDITAQLGKVSDRSLAARFGGSHWVYRSMRQSRGILPWNHERTTSEARLWDENREAALALLGKVSDNELARRFGGLQCRYTYHRKKLGIAVFDPKAPSPQISEP